MKKLKSVLLFIINNFGPLVVFYGVNHFYGLKPAIATTIVFTVGDAVYQKRKGITLGSFYWFCFFITVLFGGIDLYLQQSFLFKYEAAITNFVFGFYFASGVVAKKPFIEEFAEKAGKLPHPRPHGLTTYFKILTALWAVYFFAKGVVYFAWAKTLTIDELLGYRAVLGNISMFAMVIVSTFGSKYIFRFMLKRGWV